MSTIKLIDSHTDFHSYTKHLKFTLDGKEYFCLLYWDERDGYDLTFKDEDGDTIPIPNWVIEWENENYSDSLGWKLEELTTEGAEL